jgi:hypothetical protein
VPFPLQVLYVIDARPKLNARGNELMGKGFENTRNLGGDAKVRSQTLVESVVVVARATAA